MTEQEIFGHLFTIANQSSDTDGVVTSCLVRDGRILVDAVSAGIIHAEYALLEKLQNQKITLLPQDIIYVTLQPCSQRTPGGEGEKLGDCTTNLINAGIKHVVYAANYPKGAQSGQRFREAGVTLTQVSDKSIIDNAIELFNATCADPKDHLRRYL